MLDDCHCIFIDDSGLYCCVHVASFERLLNRARELCESRGGHPRLPVPNSPDGLSVWT